MSLYFIIFHILQLLIINVFSSFTVLQYIYIYIYYIFIQSVLCLTTGPKPPPKRCLHKMRFRASSFKWEYPLLSLRSSSSFLRLLPRLLATFIYPFIFPSITCFRRQFLRKMWPIQLAFRFLISCRIFLCSLTYIYMNMCVYIYIYTHTHIHTYTHIFTLLDSAWRWLKNVETCSWKL